MNIILDTNIKELNKEYEVKTLSNVTQFIDIETNEIIEVDYLKIHDLVEFELKNYSVKLAKHMRSKYNISESTYCYSKQSKSFNHLLKMQLMLNELRAKKELYDNEIDCFRYILGEGILDVNTVAKYSKLTRQNIYRIRKNLNKQVNLETFKQILKTNNKIKNDLIELNDSDIEKFKNIDNLTFFVEFKNNPEQLF